MGREFGVQPCLGFLQAEEFKTAGAWSIRANWPPTMGEPETHHLYDCEKSVRGGSQHPRGPPSFLFSAGWSGLTVETSVTGPGHRGSSWVPGWQAAAPMGVTTVTGAASRQCGVLEGTDSELCHSAGCASRRDRQALKPDQAQSLCHTSNTIILFSFLHFSLKGAF